MARYGRRRAKGYGDLPKAEETPIPSQTWSQHFTFSEWMNHVENGKPQGRAADANQRSSRKTNDERGWGESKDWYGTANWQEALDLAKNGWSEGVAKIGPILEKIDRSTAKDVTVPAIVNDVTGDCVDVDAYLSGQPENMLRWDEVEDTKRVARILFNIAVSGGVSTEAIQWRGATVLALVDRLEAQGIRAEVTCVIHSTQWGGYQNSTYFTVKEASEPLHLDRMAFFLVHPSSFRRLGFSGLECLPADVVNGMKFYAAGNYSQPKRMEKPADYDLMIPEMHLYSVEESVREIEKMFNQICSVQKLTV